jgi:hypothetical protein
VPTVGVLGQTRRWFIYPGGGTTQIGLILYQNVFTPTSMHSYPFATTSVTLGSTSNTFAYISVRGTRFVSGQFGVSSTNPSVIQASSQVQLFGQPSVSPNFLTTLKRADGWGDLGQQDFPRQLLVYSGSGYAVGGTYVVAAGDAATSPSGPKTLWSIVLPIESVRLWNSGYFSQWQFSIGMSLQSGLSASVRLMQFEFQSVFR